MLRLAYKNGKLLRLPLLDKPKGGARTGRMQSEVLALETRSVFDRYHHRESWRPARSHPEAHGHNPGHSGPRER